MKKLYHGKGKVHPSPDADSAFRFLPVAIATLSAALVPEDQEVLAYLIAWSLEEDNHHQSKRRPTSQGRIHRPAFGCSCFECYTSFWSRWDSSPNRHLIHQALDLFEDHMAAAGADGAARAPGRGNKNHRRAGRDDNRKQLISWMEQNRGEMQGAIVSDAEVPESGKGIIKAKQRAADVDFEDRARQQPSDKARQGLMRRMFPDFMSFVAERLWTVWSPPV